MRNHRRSRAISVAAGLGVAALGQRTKPVIIENDRLERLFSVLLFWLKYGPLALLVAYLIAFGIERGFKIDASLIHDWKIERTEGKITLTPYSK